MKLENVIYCGDNLTWLKKFPDKLVDLIYLDPPFFSNKQYEVIFHDGQEIRSFEDRWKGGINHYIGWMRERIFEMHRVLKDTGSFYLHCDWHASHYLKVMCDEIFGFKNFRNNIVWCYKTREFSKKYWNKKHDDILFYVKDINSHYPFNWNVEGIIEPYSPQTIKKYKYKDEKGYYRLVGRGIEGSPIKSAKDVSPEWEKTHPELVVRNYLGKGYAPFDYWFIDIINQAAKERLSYPTQKPELLLEKIIRASSNKNDLVLDPFCGCGTTIAVAQKLQRKWIGIDVSPTACKVMKNRVEKNGTIGIEIIGLPVNIDDLKSLKPFEFQNWCIGALGGTVNPKKVGDMGVDGFTFMLRDPIQVKQSENIGRNVIDNFETAMQRIKKTKGYIIAFSFGKGAYEEVARVKQNGLFIELLTIDKLLEYEEPSKEGKIF